MLPLQRSASGQFLTNWGAECGYTMAFIESKLPKMAKAFDANWDKVMLGASDFIDGQTNGTCAKKYLFMSDAERMRAADAGTLAADLVMAFNDMGVMNGSIAMLLSGKLDDEPNACVMLSGIPLGFMDGFIAKVGDHCDSQYTSVYKQKQCIRVKIMYYGGGADMKRDLVLIYKGKVIGGVTVEASDIVVSSDAFVEGNQLGHDKERTEIGNLYHSSRLRGGGGPSVLFTFYLELPIGTDVHKLLSEFAPLLPPATCIPATPATLRAVAEVDYPESKRIVGGYSRRHGVSRLERLQHFDRELVTYELVCSVMRPYLDAPDYRKDLLCATAPVDARNLASLVVRARARACYCALVSSS